MPTNRKRRTRKFIPVVSDEVIKYLKCGECERGDFEIFLLTGPNGRKELREIWESVKDEIMNTWIIEYSCTRPWAWWEYDAPRWERKFNAYFDGTKPEPRQRIGGTGTPNYEVLNYVPYFDKGIPENWVSEFDEEYYNGRRKDIHGNPIGTARRDGTKRKEGDFEGKAIDPDDPPVFESETAYLDRHGLLTPAEKKYLALHPELLAPEKVIFDDENLDRTTVL